ncbi:MAG: hypothetical protein FJ171_10000 [Gammaproteobacteria bacterium]|nr:hypothetical protein [Gammaproteobacteria bacterium]
MNCRTLLAALAAAIALGACSQKDPAGEAITAAENALNAVYEEAAKYVPERYAEVKKDLETARAAFKEERYADAIAAVRDVPADAEALANEAAAAKEKRIAELNADWARLSGTLPDLLAGIGGRLEELRKLRALPEGMDRQLLDEANAALASARAAWNEAGAARERGDLEAAVGKARDSEGMAQDLFGRLGMPAA